MSECMIGVVDGEVRCVTVNDGSKSANEAIREWAADPRVSELVRVPVEVARAFIFKPWPGREAAIRAIDLTKPVEG